MSRSSGFVVGVQLVVALTVGMLGVGSCAAQQPQETPPPRTTGPRSLTLAPGATQQITCSGPTTPQIRQNDGDPDTPTGVVDYPRPAQATDIRWRDAIGRFEVTLSNATCAPWKDVELYFYLGGPWSDPAEVRLEYASADGWRPIGLDWYDVDEPEDLASDELVVDFGPGEQQTHEFRLILPEALAEPSDFTGIEAILNGTATAPEHTYRWNSTPLPIESRTPHQIAVGPPESITPMGPPAEFTVTVTNHGDREDLVRLDLITSSTPVDQVSRGVERMSVEMFRGGTWHRLDAETLSGGDPDITYPSTPELALPADARRTFRFRARLGPLTSPAIHFGAQLRPVGMSFLEPPIAWGTSGPAPVRIPDVAVVAPTTLPTAGESAEFAFTVSNPSGVDYPELILRVYLTGREFVDSFTYRIDDAGSWSNIDVPTSRIDPIDLPGPEGFDAPAGTEQTHRLRLELARDPTEPIEYTVRLLDAAHGTEFQSATGKIR